MLSRMRTTLILDDGLLRQAKRRAVERNLTVSAVVNEALRESLSRTAPEAPPFQMITYGDSERRVHHEPADFSAFLEEQDLDSLR
jgi:Bacterial antitoxin of type II TA system, VapB